MVTIAGLQEGFIHATAEPDLLISVANHFYKCAYVCGHFCLCVRSLFVYLHRASPRTASGGEWICLQIDTTQLASEVKFEAPAPVGNTAPPPENEVQLFPHIYGPITAASVVAILPVHRGEDGTFLRIGEA